MREKSGGVGWQKVPERPGACQTDDERGAGTVPRRRLWCGPGGPGGGGALGVSPRHGCLVCATMVLFASRRSVDNRLLFVVTSALACGECRTGLRCRS